MSLTNCLQIASSISLLRTLFSNLKRVINFFFLITYHDHLNYIVLFRACEIQNLQTRQTHVFFLCTVEVACGWGVLKTVTSIKSASVGFNGVNIIKIFLCLSFNHCWPLISHRYNSYTLKILSDLSIAKLMKQRKDCTILLATQRIVWQLIDLSVQIWKYSVIIKHRTWNSYYVGSTIHIRWI